MFTNKFVCPIVKKTVQRSSACLSNVEKCKLVGCIAWSVFSTKLGFWKARNTCILHIHWWAGAKIATCAVLLLNALQSALGHLMRQGPFRWRAHSHSSLISLILSSKEGRDLCQVRMLTDFFFFDNNAASQALTLAP
jgi:hypothetical protein